MNSNHDPALLDALELAFDMIADLETAHGERCEIPASAWHLVSFLNWTQNTPWN